MMRTTTRATMLIILALLLGACSDRKPAEERQGGLPDTREEMVQVLLGSGDYAAIAYSGHRKVPRSVENTPTITETKEDLRILAAMGIKLLRTYNTTLYPHSRRILQAIEELKREDSGFEMHVMLGAWIQCKNAYQDGVDHMVEDEETNQREIAEALRLAAAHPEVVRIIAVGNEATVTWQAHYVPAGVILKYVKMVEEAREDGTIPAATLVTTSENWAALGGEESYRGPEHTELLGSLDFLSLHTYAFHDTYYNKALVWADPQETSLPVAEQAARAMERCIQLQNDQYQAVKDYLGELGLETPIHIGETGWASLDNALYGPDGTHAASEYNAKLFYDAAREWTGANGLTCFYFEAFDEPWKSDGTAGSEGHFGLFTVDGQAKWALWDLVDAGAFEGLSRGGHAVGKTHGGDASVVEGQLLAPRHWKFGED